MPFCSFMTKEVFLPMTSKATCIYYTKNIYLSICLSIHLFIYWCAYILMYKYRHIYMYSCPHSCTSQFVNIATFFFYNYNISIHSWVRIYKCLKYIHLDILVHELKREYLFFLLLAEYKEWISERTVQFTCGELKPLWNFKSCFSCSI